MRMCDVQLGVVYEDEVDGPDTFTLSPLLSKLYKICCCGGGVIWWYPHG